MKFEKSLLITKETHSLLKQHCATNNYKISEFADSALRSFIKDGKRKSIFSKIF